MYTHNHIWYIILFLNPLLNSTFKIACNSIGKKKLVIFKKKTRILAVIIDKRNGIGHKNEFSDMFTNIYLWRNI